MRALLTLLAILALPMAEIATFIAVGSQIGVAATLLLVIASSVLGILVVRRQSLSALQAVRTQTRVGTVPEREIVQGAITVLGGLLLIVPGFLTSLVGLLFQLPPVKNALWRQMKARVVVRATGAPYGQPRGPVHRPEVVELDAADYERREPRDGEASPHSPWRGIAPDREGDGR